MGLPALLSRFILLSIFLSFSLFAESTDQDLDGLDDDSEQEILERFRPTLRMDAKECAGLPAEFMLHRRDPLPLEANSTLYGQVFPVDPPGAEDLFVEVHYYHLWSRDCGRFGHPLDTEYVSGLIAIRPTEEAGNGWEARYWFAAAHEGTLCDMSNGAPAEAIGASRKGPVVWISRGKHASFLSRELCQKVGCGGDFCGGELTVDPLQIINLGEPGNPFNGAEWIRSEKWSLSRKMDSDYDDSGLERFENLSGVSAVQAVPHPTRPLLLAGNKTIGAVETSNSHTGNAFLEAGSQTVGAVGKLLSATGKSLKAAGSRLFGGNRQAGQGEEEEE